LSGRAEISDHLWSPDIDASDNVKTLLGSTCCDIQEIGLLDREIARSRTRWIAAQHNNNDISLATLRRMDRSDCQFGTPTEDSLEMVGDI
jgi:hypothetical protein